MKKYCLSCNSLINPNGKNISYQKYCSFKCRGKENDKKRYKNRKPYLKIKSLEYYYKNRTKVLKKQIAYKSKRYKENKLFHIKVNIRQITSHSISLENKRCSICNSNKDLQRHHEDYSNPLDIIILCRKCHNKLHKNWPREKRFKPLAQPFINLK